ncbi:MAG: hypothetical protein ACYC91_03060 [Solirubrobacteraceae bacterium]
MPACAADALDLARSRSSAAGCRPGSLLVARSVPIGPERWALLGRAPIVPLTAVALAEKLLRARLGRALGRLAAREVEPACEVPRYRRDARLVAPGPIVAGSAGSRRAA